VLLTCRGVAGHVWTCRDRVCGVGGGGCGVGGGGCGYYGGRRRRGVGDRGGDCDGRRGLSWATW